MRTEELTLPGFQHDTFSSVYPAGAASPVFARMPLHDHGLEWVHPAACSAHPLPGRRGGGPVPRRRADGRVARSPARRRRRGAGRRSPRRSSTRSRRCAPRCSPASRPSAGRCRLLAQAGPLAALRFARLLPESAVGLRRRLFEAARRARLALRRRDARRHAARRRGQRDRRRLPQPARPRGRLAEPARRRADGWPTRSVGYLRSPRRRGPHGRARSSASLSADGRVSGVALAGGERVRARIVIADVMPRRADPPGRRRAQRLVPQRPAALRARAGDAQGRLGARRADPVDRRRRCAGAGTVHVGGGEDEFLDVGRRSPWRACPSGRSCCSASRASPTRRARPGASTPPGRTRTARRAGSTGPRSTTATSSGSRRRSSASRPGSATASSARHVLGPGELEARNANLVGGDVGGGSYKLRQVVFRPLPLPSPYTTPLTRAVPRQRGDVPGRGGARRARRRRRPGRAEARAPPPGSGSACAERLIAPSSCSMASRP